MLDWLTAATTAAIYLQLLLGAVMRHTGAGLAIPDFPLAFGRVVPEITSFTVGIHFAHRVGAAIVSVLVLATAARIAVAYRDDPGWLLLSLLLVLLLVVQVTLGASIVWTRKAVLPTTAHDEDRSLGHKGRQTLEERTLAVNRVEPFGIALREAQQPRRGHA